jgi:type II secretory pathway component PulK
MKAMNESTFSNVARDAALRLNRGSALLIVLWMIGTLAVIVLSVIQPARNAQADALVRAKHLQARCLAESGLVIALHPEVSRFDPLMSSRAAGAGDGYEATSVGEFGRFAINSIIDERQQEDCAQLLRRLGLDFVEARALADALADWIDADDLRRLNGAERTDYAKAGVVGAPANRPFASVDEMSAVLGMSRLESVRPDWRDFFSTMKGPPVDINSAPAEVLDAIMRLGSRKLEAVLSTRAGADRILNTSDDVVIKDFSLFARVVGGLAPQDEERLASKFVFESPVRRVVSTGYFDDARCRLEVVAVPGVPARILSWVQM